MGNCFLTLSKMLRNEDGQLATLLRIIYMYFMHQIRSHIQHVSEHSRRLDALLIRLVKKGRWELFQISWLTTEIQTVMHMMGTDLIGTNGQSRSTGNSPSLQ